MRYVFEAESVSLHHTQALDNYQSDSSVEKLFRTSVAEIAVQFSRDRVLDCHGL